MTSLRLVPLVSLLGLLALPVPPAAAVELGAGARLGLTRGPNAFQFGAQGIVADLGIDLLAPLRFKTSVDLGFGEIGDDPNDPDDDDIDFRSVQVNFNLEYPISRPGRILAVYPLLGLGYRTSEHGSCGDAPVGDLEPCVRSSGVHLNIGGGIVYHRFGADATLGLGELPTFTVTGSYTFGL